jgi:HEAT repeat protein
VNGDSHRLMRNPSSSSPRASLRRESSENPVTNRGQRRLALAGSLSLSLVLSISFISLLVVQSREKSSSPKPDESSVTATRPIAPAHPTADRIPYGDPSSKDPFAVPASIPRFGGKFSRWNLKEYPPGWNEGIAESIHSFFEELQYDPAKPLDEDHLVEVRQRLQDYLAQLGPEAISTLGAILNAEGDFVDRRFLLYGIGNIGPKSAEATFVLRDFFAARESDPQNRSELIHAVKAMANLKNETSFGTLLDFIDRGNSDPTYHGFRGNFIEALGEHPKREQAIDTLVQTLHDDQWIDARNKSAQALGKIRSEAALPELYNAVEKEPYWIVKQTLLGSIGKTGNPDSIPFLESQARTAKESGVRLSAANAIKLIGAPQTDEILRNIARDESDEDTRKRIEGWIRRKG